MILIKGMEMPKTCRNCLLQDRLTFECRMNGKYYNWGLTERPSDCPLIEIQPHGRLIDADAAIQSLPPIEDYDSAKLCTIDTAKRLIRKAFDMQPIVIHADKDGES